MCTIPSSLLSPARHNDLLTVTCIRLPLLSSPADLDHHNPELRDSLVDWLNWLKTDVGFEGWRFDFIRGYAAKYVKE